MCFTAEIVKLPAGPREWALSIDYFVIVLYNCAVDWFLLSLNEGANLNKNQQVHQHPNKILITSMFS